MHRLLTMLLPITLTAVAYAEEPPKLTLEPAEQSRCLETLRRGLKSSEFWPAMHAAEALTQAGQGEEVRRKLAPKLATISDDQQRCGVARELVRAGDRSQVAVMLRILAGENPHGHVHACESLYKVWELGDGEELRAAFAPDVHTPKTLMAAAALARWGSPAAFAWLRRTLKGEDQTQARLAAWVLGTLGGPEDLPAINAWRAKLKTVEARHFFDNAAALLGDATARAEALKNLDHADPAVRTYAAVCAGEARLLEAKPRLLARLEDENLDAAIRAAQALLLLAQPPADNPPNFSVNVYPASARNVRNSEGSVIALRDGSLLYATTEYGNDGEDHAAARIIARRSADGGRTWGEPRELQANVGKQNVMSVTLRYLTPPTESNRPLGMFYLLKNSPTDLDVQLRVSADDGQTFGEPALVTGTPGYHVFNNDRATRLSSGRWLVPVASTADVAKVNHFVCRCFLSDDNGKTWRAGSGQVDYEKRGAMEPEVLELRDGRVLMLFRTQSGHIGRSLSSDGGDTWGPPESFGVRAPEAPATLRRIPSTGDLLLVWNDNYKPGAGHGGKRSPLTVAISQDEGKTWKFRQDLETDPGADYSYISLIFHRGRAVLSYYVQEPGSSWISSRFRSIPIAWFYATADSVSPVSQPAR